MQDASAAPPVVISPAQFPVRPPFQGLRSASRWLYTQNPFYLLSAWLVFFGLRQSFGPGAALQSSAALFGGLLTYTLLLAAAAIVVVRIARVWDDARSMLLLVVLMFVGMSIALDETLVQHPDSGRVFYLAAWCAAALTSECVLRVIRLDLPGRYRIAFHALLALFFWYPVALVPWLGKPSDTGLQWLLFGFAQLGTLCFALLWPAVRRGGAYVRGNGSLWPWPLYPWSLFAILALCVAGRAYYLCLSFHFVGRGATIFGPYFLVPLVACLSALWLTGAARTERRWIPHLLLVAPVLWIALSVFHREEALYRGFLATFVDRLHVSPLFLTLCAALAYYLYARMLRLAGAEFLMTIALLAMSIVGPRSLIFWETPHVFAWPWAVAALWNGVQAWRKRSEWRWLLTGILSAMAADLSVAGIAWEWRFAAMYHTLLLAVLLIGYWGSGPISQWLKRNAGPALLLGGMFGAWHAASTWPQHPLAAQVAYVALLAAVALAYALLVQMRVYYLSAAAIASAGGAICVWPWYARSRIVSPGLDYILIGLACLGFGLMVSLAKAGYVRRLRHWLRNYAGDTRAVAEPPAH